MRIEFKAYGGTGELIGRSFVVLMALNACNISKDESNECVIYRLDFDDNDPKGDINNDYKYLSDIVLDYKALYERKLGFLAPIALKMDNHSLKAIRAMVYPNESTYSLRSIYINNTNDAQKQEQIESFLTGIFTSDPNDPQQTKELERSNRDGNYGDLAVNSFINERIITENAYAQSGIYNDLQTAITAGANSIVFYAGSTDGGTANTNIDKDIQSLLNTFANVARTDYRLYSLRTTPYSKFEQTENDTADNAVDRAITERILKNKFQMAKGVLERIDKQNHDPARPHYYDFEDGKDYWLDGLFFGCSNTLDVTAHKIRKDNQFHPSHLVELGLAKQAMDAIAGRLPAANGEHLYVYNDGGGRIDGQTVETVTPEKFFEDATISYKPKICAWSSKDTHKLSTFFRAFLLTLVTIQSGLIPDLQECKETGRTNRMYLRHLFCTKVSLFGDITTAPNMPDLCGFMADDLIKFVKQCKFIVMAFSNVMEVSTFNVGSPVKFAESEIKYLYDTDLEGNPIEGTRLTILKDEATNRFSIAPCTDGNPKFPCLASFPTCRFKSQESGGQQLLQKEQITKKITGDPPSKGIQLANNMITRIFEWYLIDSKT